MFSLWVDGELVVSARRKGQGTVQRTVPLSAEAHEALRAFAEVHVGGLFTTSSMWKSFQRAAFEQASRACGRPICVTATAHNCTATSGDPRAVQEWLLHSTPKTTERYTQGASAGAAAAGGQGI